MAADLVVRPLQWTDFEDLATTYFGCYDERDAGEPIGIGLFDERPSRADEIEWFANLFARVSRGETIAAIADRNGHAIGSCFVGRKGPGPKSEGSHVGELGILVRRGERGAGAGTALITYALEKCRGVFEVVELSVFSNNEGAKRLYRRLGFEPCGRIPRAIRRGRTYLDSELMVRMV